MIFAEQAHNTVLVRSIPHRLRSKVFAVSCLERKFVSVHMACNEASCTTLLCLRVRHKFLPGVKRSTKFVQLHVKPLAILPRPFHNRAVFVVNTGNEIYEVCPACISTTCYPPKALPQPRRLRSQSWTDD